AELSAEERRGGHVEDLARKVPPRHFDTADRAHQVMARSVGAGAAQVARAFAHLRVELVDLQRVLADQPRLEGQHLLLDANAWRAVRLRYPVEAGVRCDLDEGVGAARAL